jgi:hypothetical protein
MYLCFYIYLTLNSMLLLFNPLYGMRVYPYLCYNLYLTLFLCYYMYLTLSMLYLSNPLYTILYYNIYLILSMNM